MSSSKLLALTAMAAMASAGRVFTSSSSKKCGDCLDKTETLCHGPVESDQFNDCLCDVKGDAWAAVEKCLQGSDAVCTEQEVSYALIDYGVHCFSYNDKEEEQICVAGSEDDPLLLSIADMNCSEFITPSSTAEATTTDASSTGTATAATTTGASSTDGADSTQATDGGSPTPAANTSSETSSSTAEPTQDSGNDDTSEGGSNNDDGDDSGDSDGDDSADDEDDAGAFFGPMPLFQAGVLALSVSGLIMNMM